MGERTPTPWQIYDVADPHHIMIKGFYPVLGGAHVADVLFHDNAAFIVTACNSHDALVKALLLALASTISAQFVPTKNISRLMPASFCRPSMKPLQRCRHDSPSGCCDMECGDVRNVGPCYTCKCEMWIPDALHEAAQAAKGVISFYCAYGHSQVYIKGESEETKLRRERDRLTQQLAEKDDDIRRQQELVEQTQRQLSAAKGRVTRIKNRVSNGVCPCCNRQFANLHRHMTTEHPTFTAEAAE